MTLEEAINFYNNSAEEHGHTKEVFSNKSIPYACHEHIAEHYMQLAEWLRELKDYREAVKEVKEYASIWMEWDEGMSKHEIAEKAMTDAKEGFIAIVEKHLKEVNADEDREE